MVDVVYFVLRVNNDINRLRSSTMTKYYLSLLYESLGGVHKCE